MADLSAMLFFTGSTELLAVYVDLRIAFSGSGNRKLHFSAIRHLYFLPEFATIKYLVEE